LVGVRDDYRRSAGVTVPPSFAAMPRWRAEGSRWLTALPRKIDMQCDRWGLRIVGPAAHGSNAIVMPVDRNGEPLVLRMTPPGPDVAELVRALRFWDGRGTVRLILDDPHAGAMLLERLSVESLATTPLDEAMEVIGRMMRRLAAPAPADVQSTTALVADRSAELSRDWTQMAQLPQPAQPAQPVDRTYLTTALDAAERLTAPANDAHTAVNADLHSAQVLRGRREPWLVVDPVLLRGDIAYDLARAIWTRLDEMADVPAIVTCFDIAVRASGVDRDRARDAVVFRTVDYWLWCLAAGLTEDPSRCERLLQAFI
jgi:streptomycin 6-kinase